MALTATVTPGKTLVSSELATNSKLNQGFSPTVSISGTVDTSGLTNDAVTADKAQFGAWFNADESGTANAHVLTASGHSIAAYATGMVVRYYPQNDNTGAVTANLNGVGARPVRKPGSASGLELQTGDLRQGQMIQLCFDMAHDQWWLQSPLANAAWDRYAETLSATANEYTATFSPTITDLVTGLRVVVKWNSTNTSTAQFNPDGKGLKAIRKAGDVALVAGDIVDNQVSQLVYDADANASAGAWILTGPTTPTTRTTVPVRQTVLSCSVASTGLPNYLSYSGQVISFQNTSTTTPVVLAFAAGYDSSGGVDYVGTIDSNVNAAWTVSTSNGTYYLYVERDATTGALSYGVSTVNLAPSYSNGSSGSTTSGQHTYLISQGKMYVGNGSTATAVQRVFVGECVVSGGVLQTPTIYMPQGRFQSSADQTVTFNATPVTETHQLGLTPRQVRWVMVNQTADANFAQYDEVDVTTLIEGAYGAYGEPPSIYANATTTGMRPDWTTYAPYLRNSSGANTALTANRWKLRCYAWRGW